VLYALPIQSTEAYLYLFLNDLFHRSCVPLDIMRILSEAFPDAVDFKGIISDADGNKKKQTKLHGLSPRANFTDRATAACRRNDCQLLRIKGATWSA
jgi:hypothetical protein